MPSDVKMGCFYCHGQAPCVNSARVSVTISGLPEFQGWTKTNSIRCCPGCMDRLRLDTGWILGERERSGKSRGAE